MSTRRDFLRRHKNDAAQRRFVGGIVSITDILPREPVPTVLEKTCAVCRARKPVEEFAWLVTSRSPNPLARSFKILASICNGCVDRLAKLSWLQRGRHAQRFSWEKTRRERTLRLDQNHAQG